MTQTPFKSSYLGPQKVKVGFRGKSRAKAWHVTPV